MVGPRVLDVAGITATRPYDGTILFDAGQITLPTGALAGVVGDDDVWLDATGVEGTVEDAGVGAGKRLTVTGLALGGDDASNYVLGTIEATASITEFVPPTDPDPDPDTDSADLEELLAEADEIVHGEQNETPAWEDFIEAKDAAEAVLNDPSATQEEIDAALEALVEAIEELGTRDGSHGFDGFSTGIGSHTIGSDETLTHTVAYDWALHTGVVTVDGDLLEQGVHYTSESGSTRTILLPSYLDTLAVGEHTLRVEFSGNLTPIVERFYVVETGSGDPDDPDDPGIPRDPGEPGDSGDAGGSGGAGGAGGGGGAGGAGAGDQGGSGSGSGGSGGKTPRTGDVSGAALLMFASCFATLGAVFAWQGYRRRRRSS
jgi:hypothetical protein